MESNNELNNLTCQIKDHSNMKIIGFCVEEKCNNKNKFACQECFFDYHSGHKLIKIEKLSDIIQNKLKDYKKYIEEEKKNNELYTKFDNFQNSYLEQLKQKISSDINEKIKQFKEKSINKLKGMINSSDKINSGIKDYEEFFVGNAAPVQRPDSVKLSEICTSIYKDKDSIIEKNESRDRNKIKNLYEESLKSLENFVNSQYTSISKYINNNFLEIKNTFSWSKKTYGDYGFFYELTNSNTKAVKKLSQGTMTVLRAKEKLIDNYLYKIKFKIGLKNLGDYDVGIGTDRTGESCWLRTKESICISNTGVINLDINMDNSVKLKDKDIVDLEINTESGNKYFKGYINNKLICLIDFDIKDVYIMAAMRNVGSYIDLESYEEFSLQE